MKIQDIEKLAQRWLAAGAISQEQATFIVNDTKDYVSVASGGKFISAITIMGTAALSLGALLFIASNWRYLGDGIKVILSLLLPILPLSFAYWKLEVQRNESVLPRAMQFFGLVLIGGAIVLIEQIYNLQSEIQNTLWIWFLLTLPFLFIFKKAENVLFSTVLLGVAIFLTLFNFLATARVEESTAVVLITLYTLLYAYLMYAVGSTFRSSEVWDKGGRLLRIVSGSIAATVLFIMTFEWYARSIVGYSYTDPTVSYMPVSFLLNIVFIGFLIFALFRATKYEEYGFAFSIVRLAGVYLLVKYYTLFYTMFDTSLFFIIGGVLFIVGGTLLEKKKNMFIGYMKQRHLSTPGAINT